MGLAKSVDLSLNEGGNVKGVHKMLISNSLRRTRSSTIVGVSLQQKEAQSPVVVLTLRRAQSSTVPALESLVQNVVDHHHRVKTPRKRRQLAVVPKRSGDEQKNSNGHKQVIEVDSSVHIPPRWLSSMMEERTSNKSNYSRSGKNEDETRSPVHRIKLRKAESFESHLYIFNTITQKSMTSHELLRSAMCDLRHWTMLPPANCCLRYKHDVVGEIVTLPWPDMDACAPDEIHDFVTAVNRVEARPVFFSRYERSPYWTAPTRASPRLSAMKLTSKKVIELDVASIY